MTCEEFQKAITTDPREADETLILNIARHGRECVRCWTQLRSSALATKATMTPTELAANDRVARETVNRAEAYLRERN